MSGMWRSFYMSSLLLFVPLREIVARLPTGNGNFLFDYAHKNITSKYSQVRSTLPEDGSQTIRNMSEFLIVF